MKELHAATNNFNYDNKLGEGAFGSVYWGQLWDGSQVMTQISSSLCFGFRFSCPYTYFLEHLTSVWSINKLLGKQRRIR